MDEKDDMWPYFSNGAMIGASLVLVRNDFMETTCLCVAEYVDTSQH